MTTATTTWIFLLSRSTHLGVQDWAGISLCPETLCSGICSWDLGPALSVEQPHPSLPSAEVVLETGSLLGEAAGHFGDRTQGYSFKLSRPPLSDHQGPEASGSRAVTMTTLILPQPQWASSFWKGFFFSIWRHSFLCQAPVTGASIGRLPEMEQNKLAGHPGLGAPTQICPTSED